jgi:hypothetical protein|tara:strand:+ start:1864 stop:2160 length:297 start_codon:yes stop_codon:yes gene_type:complete
MDLISVIAILELATACKLKSKAILSDGHLLSDHTLEINCHYFIALLDTIYIAEEMILTFSEKGESTEDASSLAELYANIQRCSEIETRLSEQINMTTH